MKKFIASSLKKFNVKNINNAIESLSKGINTFNKAVQDFGDSMDTMTREMSSDIEKSNRDAEIREKKNKENLEKIWGKRKWDVKFVKYLIKIQADISLGKNKFVDFVVISVSIFLGMETIYKNIGGLEIEFS